MILRQSKQNQRKNADEQKNKNSKRRLMRPANISENLEDIKRNTIGIRKRITLFLLTCMFGVFRLKSRLFHKLLVHSIYNILGIKSTIIKK